MKVWVTRDKKHDAENTGDVTIWKYRKKQPTVTEKGYFELPGGVVLMEIKAAQFKKSFGFNPRKGSRKQYELTLNQI